MYIRFQGKRQNKTSASKLGIFQLAYELRDQIDLPTYTHDELQKHLSWFDKHLRSPEILEEDEHHRAIAWFHPQAKEALDHIWAIKAILEEAGYHIDLVKSDDPGNEIYADGWQMIAKPRRKRR